MRQRSTISRQLASALTLATLAYGYPQPCETSIPYANATSIIASDSLSTVEDTGIASASSSTSSAASNASSSAVYCATTTLFSSTITFHEHYTTSTCANYSTTTVIPTTTIYTGNFSTTSLSTETLLSYGDLYTSGELRETPTCAPAGCFGTLSTTIPGTASTMVTSGTVTIATICPTTVYKNVTSTTTQDARCRPTNLISTIEGNGIYEPIAAKGVSMHYDYNSIDASDCCQLCIDTPGCAAGYSTSYLGRVDICALAIPSQTCGLALNYSDSAVFEYAKLGPNDLGAYRVSFGCGSVQPIVYEDNCIPAS